MCNPSMRREAKRAAVQMKAAFANPTVQADAKAAASKLAKAMASTLRTGSPTMQVASEGEAEAEIPVEPKFTMRDLAGVTAPLGYFDPAGFADGASEGKQRFYREVELKHCRVGMLAAAGFLVA